MTDSFKPFSEPDAEPDRPDVLAAALCGWLLGTALQLQQSQLWSAWVYTAFVALAPMAYRYIAIKRRANAPILRGLPAWSHMLWVAVLAALLAFGLVGLRAGWFAAHTLAPEREGQDIRVTGVVTAMPQQSDTGQRFRLKVEEARHVHGGTGEALALPDRIHLAWYPGRVLAEADPALDTSAKPPTLRAGERWQMTVRLKAPHGGVNPHGFDFELWMWEQGLQASGYVRAGPKDQAPVRLGSTGWHPVEQARQSVRDAIYNRLARATPPDGTADAEFGPQVREQMRRAGVVAALVVGDQSAIERADWDIFRATGVAHLMSISGLHITMFAWAATACVGWAWRRSRRLCEAWPAPSAALVCGIALALGYALFSGWGVPSQRTVLMLVALGSLRLSGRQWPWPQVWLLACAVVVAADPWAMLQPGFWLSFVAVGVLFATNSGAERRTSIGTEVQFDAHGPAPAETGCAASLGLTRALDWLRTHGLGMLREQWVVTVALTPLTLLLFGQVSLVGLLANLVAIPWVTLVVTPLAMAGVAWAPLWDAASAALQALGVLLAFLAQWPWATLVLPQAPAWAGAAAVLGGVLIVTRLPWSLRALGVPLVLPVLCWQAPHPPAGQFEVLAADIGQGNALLVRTERHALVFDAGPRYSLESDAGQRVLVPLLRAMGVTVDTLVLSHRDADHVGGAQAVLAFAPQARLLSSIEGDHPLRQGRTGIHMDKRADSPADARCEAGQVWQWDGVSFEVLHPLPDDYALAQKSNAMSCVLRISNGRHTALLTGDIEAPQEAQLVARNAPGSLHADLLLAPHHGSKTSSTAAFLDAVAPTVVLVQSGYRNRFGHPAAAVAARYRERRLQVVDSPHCGAAMWSSAQPELVRCQRELDKRYWRHLVP